MIVLTLPEEYGVAAFWGQWALGLLVLAAFIYLVWSDRR